MPRSVLETCDRATFFSLLPHKFMPYDALPVLVVGPLPISPPTETLASLRSGPLTPSGCAILKAWCAAVAPKGPFFRAKYYPGQLSTPPTPADIKACLDRALHAVHVTAYLREFFMGDPAHLLATWTNLARDSDTFAAFADLLRACMGAVEHSYAFHHAAAIRTLTRQLLLGPTQDLLMQMCAALCGTESAWISGERAVSLLQVLALDGPASLASVSHALRLLRSADLFYYRVSPDRPAGLYQVYTAFPQPCVDLLTALVGAGHLDAAACLLNDFHMPMTVHATTPRGLLGPVLQLAEFAVGNPDEDCPAVKGVCNGLSICRGGFLDVATQQPVWTIHGAVVRLLASSASAPSAPSYTSPILRQGIRLLCETFGAYVARTKLACEGRGRGGTCGSVSSTAPSFKTADGVSTAPVLATLIRIVETVGVNGNGGLHLAVLKALQACLPVWHGFLTCCADEPASILWLFGLVLRIYYKAKDAADAADTSECLAKAQAMVVAHVNLKYSVFGSAFCCSCVALLLETAEGDALVAGSKSMHHLLQLDPEMGSSVLSRELGVRVVDVLFRMVRVDNPHMGAVLEALSGWISRDRVGVGCPHTGAIRRLCKEAARLEPDVPTHKRCADPDTRAKVLEVMCSGTCMN